MFTHDPVMPWTYVEKDQLGKIVAAASSVTA